MPLIKVNKNLVYLNEEFKKSLSKPLFKSLFYDLVELSQYSNDKYQDKK